MPSPNTATDAQLEDVSAVSATDVWAVGRRLQLHIEHRADCYPALRSRKRNTDAYGVTHAAADAHGNSDRGDRHSRTFDDPGSVWHPDAYAYAFPDPNGDQDTFANTDSHGDTNTEPEWHRLLPSAAAISDP